MSEIPQAFRDAIETEWRHDDKMNADTLTMRLRITARSMQSSEDAAQYKDLIEKHVAFELYKLVSGIVGEGAENAELRELLKYTWHFILGSTNGAISACEWYEKALSIHDRMLALKIKVDE